jgi:hypothetical protein
MVLSLVGAIVVLISAIVLRDQYILYKKLFWEFKDTKIYSKFNMILYSTLLIIGAVLFVLGFTV